ncbi:MAG: GntR family transcriptional regulator [Lachnospiraceae bacterium]|nr:GntR family transcriptional regulator [Lachnospiraceae bacterium]
MISFEQFLMDDSGPIYLQIIGYVKSGIVAGNIRDGDEMPSRRVLSALLGVNPNTIQKAYALLEEEGIIHSRSGAKSYVVLDEEKTEAIREELLKHTVQTVVNSMKHMGVFRAEALALIDKYWD